MKLGEMAVSILMMADRNGHRLTQLELGTKSTGVFWSAHCRDCGAMAMAEFNEAGVVVRGGTTQVRKCSAVQSSKRRRQIRARMKCNRTS